jgi:hypothetical protein
MKVWLCNLKTPKAKTWWYKVAETNKVEAYNGFADWIAFGNPYLVIASNELNEHKKAIKYTDIMANCAML